MRGNPGSSCQDVSRERRLRLRPRREQRTPDLPSTSTNRAKQTTGRRFKGDDLLIEIAWCYYHEGLNQNEIADLLSVSRSTVVNQLQEARARDYIRVSLRPSVFGGHELADELCARYGLADAIVVPSGTGDEDAALLRTARVAADWLPDLLTAGDRLGVSWGRTVFEVAEAVSETRIGGLTVIQLVGSRSTPYGFEAETCSSNLARRLGARCVNLHAPLVLSNADLARQLRCEPVISEQMHAVDTCNKTIFAAGSCNVDSHVVESDVVDASLLKDYVKRGAAGVICGRFIDFDGVPIPGEIDDRLIGVALENMRGKETGILVSSGQDKVVPMRAALLGGYATHVATCSKTAAAILEND